MQTRFRPPEWYTELLRLVVSRLFFGLPFTMCEAGVRDGISLGFEPFPKLADTYEIENSIYQLNKILDSLDP